MSLPLEDVDEKSPVLNMPLALLDILHEAFELGSKILIHNLMPFNLKLKGIHYVSENLSKVCVRSLLCPTVINSKAGSVNAGGELPETS